MWLPNRARTHFTATLFEFLRNTDLDARNIFRPRAASFEQNQFGGTVGGPIRKNKIFFFADYQGTRSTQGVDTGVDSGSFAARNAPGNCLARLPRNGQREHTWANPC